MSFSANSNQREQSRKILEELQLKKQMLLKQGVQQNSNLNNSNSLNSISNIMTNNFSSPVLENSNISNLQRPALNLAQSQTFGYFVTQDSSFGNIILPVLPRFETK